ncbi:unnamed protein product [Ilex paraguariensis]|uniref:Uncharacterized protein n=1 Tax=Ilex paraguariensis TaxID=185542 RepID=A0ABC8T2X4_9AQUA
MAHKRLTLSSPFWDQITQDQKKDVNSYSTMVSDVSEIEKNYGNYGHIDYEFPLVCLHLSVGFFNQDVVFDYNDMMRIPVLNDYIRRTNEQTVRVRAETGEEVASQDFFLPGVLPKVPGRFYYLFGKPIQTKGREKELKHKESANKLYLQIKSEIECNLAYLIKKREEDPYRGIIDRTVYGAISYPIDQVPTFEP